VVGVRLRIGRKTLNLAAAGVRTRILVDLASVKLRQRPASPAACWATSFRDVGKDPRIDGSFLPLELM